MRALNNSPTAQNRLDRSRLPAIDSYIEQAGLKWRSGRGVEQRFDCPLAAHTHNGNLTINTSKGLWNCVGGCGGGDVLALHMARAGFTFVEAARDLGAWIEYVGDEPRAQATIRPASIAPECREADPDADAAAASEAIRKRKLAAAIWRETAPIAGPARDYLTGRGCALPPVDSDLRWMPNLEIFGFTGAALVGRISLAEDATRAIGLHLTWLKLDGDHWIRGERRYLGKKSGGVVRLWPDEAITTGLAIAEGIESALAAAHLFKPTWACLDAGNLAKFPVLPGVEVLTIFADNDASGAGQRAAVACGERWLKEDYAVRVIMSDDVGSDVADEVAACS